MSTAPLTIAIAGATGNLGSDITNAILKLYPTTVSRILILTPNPTSEKAKAFEKLGVEVVPVEGSVSAQALAGVDVVINSWNHGVGDDIQLSLSKAAAESGVKVYFPSEFGYDTRSSQTNHKNWNSKKRLQAAARAASPNLKVIAVYTAAFLENFIQPYLGLDTANKHFTALGSADGKFSLTAKADIAASVTRLALLAAANPSSVPDHVRLAGDTKSIRELAEIFGRASGETIQVTEEPVGILPDGEQDGVPALLRLLRIGMTNGEIDFSKDNQGELVNPGQSLWKWKTAEAYAKETKGNP